MIDKNFIKIGDDVHQQFSILSDNFHNKLNPDGKGFVLATFRLSDMKSEGEYLFISFEDNLMSDKGVYLPLELEKNE